MTSPTPPQATDSVDGATVNADAVDVDPRVIDLLSDTLKAEGPAPGRIDTHGALVLLGRQTVFKIKRRKRFPYMDFSTLAARAQASAAEIRLNRRTAPDFYLGLRPVLEDSDGLHLGALQTGIGSDGPLDVPANCVEWVVVMKPFDGTRLLSALAAEDALPPSMLRQLADRVHAFHDAEPPARSTQTASIQAVIDGNIDELAGCDDLDAEDRRRLATLSRERLDRLRGRLEARAADGHVRHCHGDLHLGNVVATDEGPMPFDALEFDEDLATIDTAYDNAFLLMDLDRYGLRNGANAFLNRSLDQSADYGSLGPLPLFLSMRAAIRAKIGISAAATQADDRAADDKRAEAADYLRRSVTYLSPPDPIVVAVGGLSGTGKTSVANAVAPDIGAAPGAVVLRSDVIRKRLAGVPETETLDPSWYTAEASSRIYEEMAMIARQIIADGHSVIFDAVAAKPDERDLLEAAAGGQPFVGLWLTADPDLLKTRVTDRQGDASDATADVVERQTQYDLGPLSWTTIQADDKLDSVAERAIAVIGQSAKPEKQPGSI